MLTNLVALGLKLARPTMRPGSRSLSSRPRRISRLRRVMLPECRTGTALGDRQLRGADQPDLHAADGSFPGVVYAPVRTAINDFVIPRNRSRWMAASGNNVASMR